MSDEPLSYRAAYFESVRVYQEEKRKAEQLTESNRQLREELEGLKARNLIRAIERTMNMTTVLDDSINELYKDTLERVS